MPYYEFDKNDILYNTIEAHPFCEFVLYTGSVYYNNHSGTVHNLPNGYISLNEINVNRDPTKHTYNSDLGTGDKHLVYPFITKDGSMDAFATVSTTNFRFGGYGDELTSSYPMTASVGRYYVADGVSSRNRNRINSLRTSIMNYQRVSPKFSFSGENPDTVNLNTAPVGLVTIPSIFYGSALQKGTVKLKFYVTGSLVAEAHDVYKNGEMIQVTGSTTGHCVGLVLYKEGMILMTGSSTIKTTNDNYNICEIKTDGAGSSVADNDFKWIYWGEMGLHEGPLGSGYCQDDGTDVGLIKSSSYSLEFNGTTRTPVMTMFAHAPKGELNFSSNPTFKPKQGYTRVHSASVGALEYAEPHRLTAKNTMSSSYAHHSASYKKQTFISYVKIYDEDHECIAIAKVAKPIKKLEERGYTFKLKLDI